MIIELNRGDTRALVARRGAELLSCTQNEQEVIWPGDSGSWPRSAPVLFPFCGWLNGGVFRHKGRAYQSGVHGFAPDATFDVVALEAGAVHLRLTDDPDTLAMFPFRFELDVRIALTETGIDYAFAVANPGKEPLPYALGFHPGFRWPRGREERGAYCLNFSEPEEPFAARTAPGGLFTGERVPIPLKESRLDIAAALVERDSIVMLDARSRLVDLVGPDGGVIRVETHGFPHWVFWSLPGAGYLCIEGWTGQGDPVGFAGEITAKPGMILLAPGQMQRHGFSIRCLAAR